MGNVQVQVCTTSCESYDTQLIKHASLKCSVPARHRTERCNRQAQELSIIVNFADGQFFSRAGVGLFLESPMLNEEMVKVELNKH